MTEIIRAVMKRTVARDFAYLKKISREMSNLEISNSATMKIR